MYLMTLQCVGGTGVGAGQTPAYHTNGHGMAGADTNMQYDDEFSSTPRYNAAHVNIPISGLVGQMNL
jgi:hypothetical protein